MCQNLHIYCSHWSLDEFDCLEKQKLVVKPNHFTNLKDLSDSYLYVMFLMKNRMKYKVEISEWVKVITLTNHDLSETLDLWGVMQSNGFFVVRYYAFQSQRFAPMILMSPREHFCTYNSLGHA